MSGPPPDLDDLRHDREARRGVEATHLAARRETWLLVGLAVIFGVIAFLFLSGFLGGALQEFNNLLEQLDTR